MFPYLIVKNLTNRAINNTVKFLKRDYLEIRFIKNIDKIRSFYETSVTKNIERIQKDLFTYNNKYGFISGNKILIESKEKLYWNVDVIDCFENFANNISYWGISVSFVDKTNLITQIKSISYYLPFLEEFFYCAENQGCYLNDRKLNIFNSSKSLISNGINTFIERNLGSNILSVMYCAADRINVAKITADDNLRALAKLVMSEVKGKIISENNTIVIGNESAIDISYLSR